MLNLICQNCMEWCFLYGGKGGGILKPVLLYQLIEAEWRINASVNEPSLGQIMVVASLAPSHYLKQCWNIVNSNLRNTHQRNLKWNSYIFIEENAFENVVWKMAAILSRPQWVNWDGCWQDIPSKLSAVENAVPINADKWLFLAATKQLYKWYFPSVCPSVRLSVRLSVRHTFLTMFPSSYHHEIFKSYYQWQKWRPC